MEIVAKLSTKHSESALQKGEFYGMEFMISDKINNLQCLYFLNTMHSIC